ncbi:Beclin-1 [Trichinella spiralis]|uniref:Beclin-1 n=1 Tax=Trichinella spiralis TaxID=6334 RepID=A0ABR3KEL7_TRISP
MLNFERCLKQIVKSIRQFTDPNPSFTMMNKVIGESKRIKIEAARTLRNQQIHSFSIDPLNKILAEKIEEAKKEKTKLDRARAEYDLALEKLKAASEKNLDQFYIIMEEKKNAFEAQAHIWHNGWIRCQMLNR